MELQSFPKAPLRRLTRAAALLALILIPFAFFGSALDVWLLATLETTPARTVVAALVVSLLAADVSLALAGAIALPLMAMLAMRALSARDV